MMVWGRAEERGMSEGGEIRGWIEGEEKEAREGLG